KSTGPPPTASPATAKPTPQPTAPNPAASPNTNPALRLRLLAEDLLRRHPPRRTLARTLPAPTPPAAAADVLGPASPDEAGADAEFEPELAVLDAERAERAERGRGGVGRGEDAAEGVCERVRPESVPEEAERFVEGFEGSDGHGFVLVITTLLRLRGRLFTTHSPPHHHGRIHERTCYSF
ncbi:hypothetical protein V498_10374, partial [Pseudogymnoascus sp. VKM F-4517 (FW-2822)]